MNGCQLFCAACLDIPGEYENKYIIKSINLADRKKLQKYKKQLHQLFEQIKKDFEYIYLMPEGRDLQPVDSYAQLKEIAGNNWMMLIAAKTDVLES